MSRARSRARRTVVIVAGALALATAWPGGAPAQRGPAGPGGGGPAARPAQAPPGCVRGRDMMTAEEWAQHRQRLRDAGSGEARLAIHQEMRERMRQRARERRDLPLCSDMPHARGPRAGRGAGPPALEDGAPGDRARPGAPDAPEAPEDRETPGEEE